MTTLSQDIPQMDIVIHRGADEEFFCRWTVDNRDGEGFVPKDLTEWGATFRLECAGVNFYSKSCITDSYGYSIAQIPGSASESSSWDSYPFGSWRMDAKGPDGQRELLGWGNYELVG